MLQACLDDLEELFFLELIHYQGEADQGVIDVQILNELLDEVCRERALLNGQVAEVFEACVHSGEEGLNLADALNAELVHIEELNALFLREGCYHLVEFSHTFLVYDKILIGLASKQQ